VLAALAAREGPLGAWASARVIPREAPPRSPRAPRVRKRETPELPAISDARGAVAASLDAEERLVYESLSVVARHVDELTRLTGLSAPTVQTALLTLVLAGIVTDRGAGMYIRG
jgi:predicted Rossmann fold nucleotide-binding protein DprA/Smf involved in DNA uptake